MKLRVNLTRPDGQPTTVQIVADGTATANDVATAIASAGREEPLSPAPQSLSLLVSGDYRGREVLSPETPLAESGVRSGSTLALVDSYRQSRSDKVGASVQILSGADAGTEVQVRVGGSTIGRSPECDVRLSDPRASKRHARLLVGRQIEIIDENSANGVLVGGRRVTRVVLKPGDVAVIGDTRLRVAALAGVDVDAGGSEIRHLRPPVVQSRPVAGEIELPEVPAPIRKTPFPWLALLAPLIMGGVMFAVSRSPMTLMFIAMSPVLMLGSFIGNLVDAKRKHKTDLANFEEAMVQVQEEILTSRSLETRQLERLYPSVSECVGAAVSRTKLLWMRRPEHPEFLHVRLGLGDQAARVVIKEPRRNGIAHLIKRQRTLIDENRMLKKVPIVANLRSVGGVGLAGDQRHVTGIARGAVAQAAIMHSPAELIIACLTSSIGKAQWGWLDWLPHCSSPHSPIPGALLAADDATGRALVDRIEELVDTRLGEDSPLARGPLEGSERLTVPVTPAILVVVDDASVPTERLASIAERGPDVGVHVLWVAADRAGIPAACRTYLEIDANQGATIGMVRSERVVKNVSTESMDLETALVTARNLAPVVDASVPIDDDSDLPRLVSVVGLLGQEEAVDPKQVLSRWQQNGSLTDRSGPVVPRERPGDLRALVGHNGLEPFTIDLRSQGPHALVGGTTGAGKSEFLQAWVLGMAHANSPDRITFLFVDYKGGAAFAKCVDLPHCVGIVTDLSPYLVRRALRSLRAEIRRREHLFNDKGVKDLVDFEKTGDPECPPSLIIVVDEFAALVGEVPEFVDGVIDVAQRGRSLGLHLILATQRPAGVIKDSLRANTNLRIALRMNDAHDSSDVLGSAVAAEIDPANPGRGVARVGPGRLIAFQSAFPGARTPAEPPAPPIDVMELDFGVETPWKIPRPKRVGAEVDKDIDRVVDALAEAATLGGVPAPRRPWLETLSGGYDLAGLNQRADHHIVLGVVDDPDMQAQRTAFFEPDESGNIVYYGAGGSGKTTALRSLAIAASITPRSGPVHIYALDFAGGGLSLLEPLVNVGAVIAGDDDERVARVMTMLSKKLDERAARYNAVRADSLTTYRKQPGKSDEPRILVLVDGVGAFRTEYDSGLQRQAVWAQFQRLVNEGRSVGIHFAVTADRAMAVPSSMQGAFQHRVVLRMTDADAYMALSVPKDVLSSASPPGRCMNADDPNELQLAVLGKDPSPIGQGRAIELLNASLSAFHRNRPEPVRRLPALVSARDLPTTIDGKPALGIEDASLAAVGFDPQGVYLVAGPPKSGLSSALGWFGESMRRALPDVPRVLLSPRASEIEVLPLWTVKVIGTPQIRSYLTDVLSKHLASQATGSKPSIAVYIDRFGELIGSEVDQALAEALKQARRNGHLLFAGGETASFAGFTPLVTEAKNARAGLLLRPDAGDGDLIKAQLPRVRASDFPVGRGFWAANNSLLKVQLPEVD